jgi:hypothetical protein
VSRVCVTWRAVAASPLAPSTSKRPRLDAPVLTLRDSARCRWGARAMRAQVLVVDTHARTAHTWGRCSWARRPWAVDRRGLFTSTPCAGVFIGLNVIVAVAMIITYWKYSTCVRVCRACCVRCRRRRWVGVGRWPLDKTGMGAQVATSASTSSASGCWFKAF